jgi:hypothetical protein
MIPNDNARFETLHAYFLDRLLPVGNLCAGADGDPRYDARRMAGLLIAGLRQPHPASQ